MPAPLDPRGDDEHHPSRPGEIARLLRHLERANPAVKPDPAGLDLADHQLILDPVLIVDVIDIDVRRVGGDIVKQTPESVSGREVPCAVPRALHGDAGRLRLDIRLLLNQRTSLPVTVPAP